MKAWISALSLLLIVDQANSQGVRSTLISAAPANRVDQGGTLVANQSDGASPVSLRHANRADTPSPWTEQNPFIRRLDHGSVASPFVDPQNPPQLELIFVSWNGSRLEVGCTYHNLSFGIVKIEGREISDERSGSKGFYPYATLEVSNDNEGEWIEAGKSPFPLEGIEIATLVPPNPPNQPSDGYRGSLEVNLDAFRPLVRKFKFGRVVLSNGGTSQLIVLTDLLPPKTQE